MVRHGFTLILAGWLASAGIANAQADLPLVDRADFAKVKANCERLLEALAELKAPLPPETERSLRELLKNGDKDDEALVKVQQLLDRHSLIGVTINPESRVKAARGPAKAALVHGDWTVVLAKVQNDAGVTQALQLTGPQLIHAAEPTNADRWLVAEVFHRKPMPAKLSGHELEYVILRFSTKEAGKREARLIFDVGQGTQDLGFRAEVPILFTIQDK